MSENKLTPMQEHYELLVWWRDEIIKKKHAVPENIEYYDGMIWAFELLMNSIEVKGLEKEKEVIIETSKNSYIAGYLDNQCKVDDSMNFSKEYYNETFNTKEKR